MSEPRSPLAANASAPSRSRLGLAAAYTLFAVIATAANLLSQAVVLKLWPGPWPLLLAMAVGTGVGLVVKYVLDKRYIFRFVTRDAAHDGRTFVLYTATGVFTTVIFWGFELGFQYVFGTTFARNLGAVLGLSIGYIAKYQLDKRHVFRQESSA